MKPVPFMKAAMELSDICYEIENAEAEISDALLKRFGEAEAHLASSIDRRKAFLDEIKSKKALGKERKKQIDRAIKTLDRIEDGLRKITIQAMKTYPDEPFRDSLGQKLAVAKAKPKLCLSLGATVSITNVVPDDIDIDSRFLKTALYYCIDKEAVAEALKDGEELGWANFEQTEYLRGL